MCLFCENTLKILNVETQSLCNLISTQSSGDLRYRWFQSKRGFYHLVFSRIIVELFIVRFFFHLLQIRNCNAFTIFEPHLFGKECKRDVTCNIFRGYIFQTEFV